MHLLLAALATTLATGPRLVTTSWLAAHLSDPDLVILHVGGSGTYGSHIPGAIRTELTQLADNAGMDADTTRLSVEMLAPEVLRTKLESYGISDRSTIVVYAANERVVFSSTRIVFTLRVAGLGAHAALLDGGLSAWTSEKRPVTADIPHPSPGHITVTPAPSLVVDADWVQAHLHRPGIVVIDARARTFYDGTEQGEKRLGHIPTARSLSFSQMLDSTNHYKSLAALKTLFRSIGASPGDTIVAYCHIGMQATVVLLAADQIGYPTKLYDGSFEDWARRKDLPVVDPTITSK